MSGIEREGVFSWTVTENGSITQATLEAVVTRPRSLSFVRGFMGAVPSLRILLFPGVNEIHSAFMREAIDIWFLTRLDLNRYRVLEHQRLSPWRYARRREADAVLEAWPGLLPVGWQTLRLREEPQSDGVRALI